MHSDRNMLDAQLLLADCLEASGLIEDAKAARLKEVEVRAELTNRETEDALRLGEAPPNFERHSR